MAKKNPIVQNALKLKDYNKKKSWGLYLDYRWLQGIHNTYHYYLIGPRGCGKSVVSMEDVIRAKRQYGYENVKCFYFRVSDVSIKALLANHASKAVDPILIAKYNMDITCKNNIVYDHGKPLFEAYPLVSAAKVGKGVCLYDANFLNNRPINPKTGKPIKRFIFTITDEFLMAEGIEKRSVGDPYSQWLIYRESILRDQQKLDYDAVKMYYLANTVGEAASWMGRALNYIPAPGDFGYKKLKRKHAMVLNIEPSEKYIEKRKNSIVGDSIDFDEDSNYTNIAKLDMESLKDKHTRINKVSMLLKFSKDKEHWYCLYDGRYIRKYRGETIAKSKQYGMVRHVDETYTDEIKENIFLIYEQRGFEYCDLLSMAAFKEDMKRLKTK